MMTALSPDGDINLTEEEAIEKGLSFFEKLSIDGMKAVWSEKKDNTLTVNFAFTENDVIIYSDLIKVKISLTTGDIIGYEAKTYYLNHTERAVSSPSITKEEALKKTPSDLDVKLIRLAIVPKGKAKEALCYEIAGTVEGETYYYYINALNGRQEELFKVVKGTEGNLLI